MEEITFRTGFLMVALVLSVSPGALAQPVETEEEPVEILRERPEEGWPPEPREKITPEEERTPEVPEKTTREELGPAEEFRLNELESELATGKITKTEYEIEKDALLRDTAIEL